MYVERNKQELQSSPTRRSSDLRPKYRSTFEHIRLIVEIELLGLFGRIFFVFYINLRHSSHKSVRDRKSTRLNSSHVSSSYAVFCLKKKRQRSARPDLESIL